MLDQDSEALFATHARDKNQLRMKELDLFSEQLGHIASVAAFLGSNSWFGMLEVIDITPSSTTTEVLLKYFYFICASLGFACCGLSAVGAAFVMMFGTQKAVRGRKADVERTIKEMYFFRKQLVRLLVAAVVFNMLMSASVQLARGCPNGRALGLSVTVAVLMVCASLFLVVYVKRIHGVFHVEKEMTWDGVGSGWDKRGEAESTPYLRPADRRSSRGEMVRGNGREEIK
ncbi:hypothetical protein TrVE_jg3185 [Triparma verrucosa]|uniref:Transmembrane protein n=1 Tax=Triparma verrucosa TaxID=1606542 RepID=A0A9W7BUS5_9STRA|nr:hypothetical protein TrVE_jg3185 [Triparma verrucosa]